MKQIPRIQLQISLFLLAVISTSLACSLTGQSLPKIINHPQPELSIDHQIFESAGCPLVSGFQRCSPESPLADLGCKMIRPTGNLLGGLQPAFPIHFCLTEALSSDQKPLESEYIYAEGCLLKHYIKYVIWQDGKFQLVKSQQDFQEVYAPIESEIEALSYAIGITGLGAQYGQEPNRTFRYFVNEIEDSHVNRTQDGFMVHLFDYRLCGCGPHPTYSVQILVKPTGDWEEVNRTKLYEDPEQDDLCVD
ncbi:MAG TPA: hypothetical protein VLM80_00610 [Anaerolineales bacterium]|nr:hypothetical protein [Anaerolineales bacterium]